MEGAPSSAIATLPPDFVDGRPVLQPARVVERRVAHPKGRRVEQALVEWLEGSQADTSWEPVEWIRRRFPSLLDDKDSLIGEGVDTSNTTPSSPEQLVIVEELEESESDQNDEEDQREKSLKASVAEVQKAQRADGRSKRQSKPPVKYADFVSH